MRFLEQRVLRLARTSETIRPNGGWEPRVTRGDSATGLRGRASGILWRRADPQPWDTMFAACGRGERGSSAELVTEPARIVSLPLDALERHSHDSGTAAARSEIEQALRERSPRRDRPARFMSISIWGRNDPEGAVSVPCRHGAGVYWRVPRRLARTQSVGARVSSGTGSRPHPPCPSPPDRLIEELALKDRALEEAFDGITISDARLPDNPLIYVNSGFERLTGYSRDEVLGLNCRFLQGPAVSQSELEKIRASLRDQTPTTVLLQNFRKDGSLFWNRLSITPVRDASGVVTHFIGVQSDVTEEQNTRDALKSANLELQAANDRVRRDLEAAARVQRWFLPSRLPEVPGVRLASVFRPCTELAGDMFSALQLGGDEIGLYVLDVSGHGVASSLLSVTVSHVLSSGGDPSSVEPGASILRSPARALERLNRQFRTAPETAQYFTIVCALFDAGSRRLRYASAGHWEPILVPREGNARRLASGGLPIGLFPDSEYSEESVQLNPGERVYLYTDGILDAESGTGEHFGMQRLLDRLERSRDRSVAEGLDLLLVELEAWTGSTDLQDDISVLALEVTSS